MKTDLLHSTAAALLAGLLLLPVTLPDSARATESPTAALSAEAIDRLSPAGRTAGAPAGPAGLLYGLPGAPSPVLTQKHLVYAPDSPGAAASNTSDTTNSGYRHVTVTIPLTTHTDHARAQPRPGEGGVISSTEGARTAAPRRPAPAHRGG